MSEACFSNKLEVSSTIDGRYTVFSRVTKKTYAIGVNEYFVLSNLNGIHTSDELARMSKIYTEEQINRLVSQFEKLGFVKGTEGSYKQSLFRLSLGIVNPNRFIKSDHFLTKIFANVVMWISLLLFVMGFYVVVMSLEQVVQEIEESLRTPVSLIVIPVFLIVVLLHECGHILLARYYGVNVPEAGVVLYFFMPGAYVNLAGVTLLKERKKRITIYLGGIFVNAGLTGIGFLSYYFVPQHIKWFFLWFAFENLLYIVVNLFIYLKMDGYLVMQELLEENKLMEHAYHYFTTGVEIFFPKAHGNSPYKVVKAWNEVEIKEGEFRKEIWRAYFGAVLLFVPVIFLSIVLSFD